MSDTARRAIVIDDEKPIRDLLSHVLSNCGYTVQTYDSPAQEAIYADPENCPMSSGRPGAFATSPNCAEVVVTDVCMPSIGGMEFVRKLRSVGCPARHVAMISAYWTSDDRRDAEAMGCVVFSKPFDLAMFRAWLQSLPA